MKYLVIILSLFFVSELEAGRFRGRIASCLGMHSVMKKPIRVEHKVVKETIVQPIPVEIYQTESYYTYPRHENIRYRRVFRRNVCTGPNCR